MDFQRFGIDERLARAAEGLGVRAVFCEKMLEHAVQMSENVCAKISLSSGREEVCLLPALQWLLSAPAADAAPERRVLVVAADAESARKAALAATNLGSGAGIEVCLVLEADQVESGSAPILEGNPAAPVVAGTLSSLLAAGQAEAIRLREFGFLVALEAERLAELPTELMRKLAGALLPSWERRTILGCSKITVKAKNLAWDLADNPSEIHIEEMVAKVQGVTLETWKVPTESKLRFLLGLLGREEPEALCVFCNLRTTADEVTRRLCANGHPANTIAGALTPERKFAMLENAKSGGGHVLVLTDEGAEGITPGSFPLVVNYDFPLEPEYFVKRLELLDREAPKAKVVNMACDRYIYGLTAVEQYIDSKLEARPVDDSLLAAELKSEGAASDRGRPREYDRRSRDDRSPDIRRSISEATGGAIDMGAVGSEPREAGPRRRDGRWGPARPEAHPRPEGRVPENRPRSDGRPRPEGRAPENRQRSDGRPRPEGHPRPDGRAQDRREGQKGGGRHDGRRGGQQRGQQRGQRPSPGAVPGAPDRSQAARSPRSSVSGNPYDLPMEERMRRYREKYGKRLENERSDEKRGAEGRGGAPRRDSRPAKPGADARQGSPTPAKNQPRPAAPGPTKTPGQTPRDAGGNPSEKNGLFDRIIGAFKKKPE